MRMKMGKGGGGVNLCLPLLIQRKEEQLDRIRHMFKYLHDTVLWQYSLPLGIQWSIQQFWSI